MIVLKVTLGDSLFCELDEVKIGLLIIEVTVVLPHQFTPKTLETFHEGKVKSL